MSFPFCLELAELEDSSPVRKKARKLVKAKKVPKVGTKSWLNQKIGVLEIQTYSPSAETNEGHGQSPKTPPQLSEAAGDETPPQPTPPPILQSSQSSAGTTLTLKLTFGRKLLKADKDDFVSARIQSLLVFNFVRCLTYLISVSQKLVWEILIWTTGLNAPRLFLIFCWKRNPL